MKDLVQFSKKMGAGAFYAFNFIPTGRARNIVDLDITPEMRERMLQIIQRHLDERETSLTST